MKCVILLFYSLYPCFHLLDIRYKIPQAQGPKSYPYILLDHKIMIISSNCIIKLNIDGTIDAEYIGIFFEREVAFFFETTDYYLFIRQLEYHQQNDCFLFQKNPNDPYIGHEVIDIYTDNMYEYSFDYISDNTLLWSYNAYDVSYITILEIDAVNTINDSHIFKSLSSTVWSRQMYWLNAHMFQCTVIHSFQYICVFSQRDVENGPFTTRYIFVDKNNNPVEHQTFCFGNLIQTIWVPMLRKAKFGSDIIILIGVIDLNRILHIYIEYPFTNSSRFSSCFTKKPSEELNTLKKPRTWLCTIDFIMPNEGTLIYSVHDEIAIQIGIYRVPLQKIVTFDIREHYNVLSLRLFHFNQKYAVLFTLETRETYYELLLVPFCKDDSFTIFQYEKK